MNPAKAERPDGLRVPFGESIADGRMYQPLDVPLGKACGCVCPGCREPLIAKHCVGGKTVPHFAHQNSSNCPTGYVTALHKAAIQLILDRKKVYVPDYLAHYHGHDRYGGGHTVVKRVVWAQELPLTSAKTEVPFLDESLPECRVVPDVLAESSIGLLNIEVAVTHFIDEEKRAKLKRLGLATVEVDLADLDRVDFGVLDDILFRPNERIRWVYNPGDAHFRDEAQKELDLVIAEAEKKAAEKQAERDALEAELAAERRAFAKKQREWEAEKRRAKNEELRRATRFKASPEPEKLGKMLRFLSLRKLPAFLPLAVRGGGSFGVRDPGVWQLALISGIIGASMQKGHHAVNVDYAITWLRYRFDIRPAFDNADKVAIWDFLVGLTALGVLRRSDRGYFEILVADARALLNLVEYRNRLKQDGEAPTVADTWLEWAPEECWPDQHIAERVASQHAGGRRFFSQTDDGGWLKMASLLPVARITDVSTVVGHYVKEAQLPHALGYLVAAGYLRIKPHRQSPTAA